MRALLLALVLLPLVTYGGALGLVFASQRRLIFPAPQPARTPELPNGTVVRLPAVNEGAEAVAVYLPPPPGGRVLTHFHDSRQQLADLASLATLASEHELGFYAVEYPGYGIAQGTPSEQSLYDAGDQALAYLRGTLGVPVERTVLMGEGIGSAVAVEMARRGKGTRLILVSPLTSVLDLVEHTIRWLPLRYLLRERFDVINRAAEVTVPVLVVHGEKDETIPFSMGKRLAERFVNGRFIAVPEAGHTDVLKTGDTLSEVLSFAIEGDSSAAERRKTEAARDDRPAGQATAHESP